MHIPLDEVRAEWEQTCGPHHIQRVAEHYGVYKDLFGEATFVPRVALRVQYNAEHDTVMPVYYGNVVTPSEVSVSLLMFLVLGANIILVVLITFICCFRPQWLQR